jgi:hypothetical protein
MPDILREILKGWPMMARVEDPSLKFQIDGEASMTFVGFTADEIKEILAAYREHMTLMISLGQQAMNAQTSADAVRYRPGPVFDGLDDARPRG